MPEVITGLSLLLLFGSQVLLRRGLGLLAVAVGEHGCVTERRLKLDLPSSAAVSVVERGKGALLSAEGTMRPEQRRARIKDSRELALQDWMGTAAFDRKEFGMNSGIPFIKIADRVEVTVDLKGKRVSGPPVVFK